MSGFAPLGSFKGTAGSGLGLGGIAGALGALLQGFTQGKELKLQNQQAQQNLSDDRTRNTLSTFQMLQGISPEALQNPAFKPFLQSIQSQSGGLPILDEQGNVNTSLFQKPLSSFTGSPQYQEFNEYAQDSPQRKQMLSGANLSQGDQADLLNNPQTYSPAQMDNANSTIQRMQALVANGSVVPENSPSFVDVYNQNAKIAGLPPYSGIAMGAKTTAGIAKTNAQTAGTQASTQLKQLKIGAFPAMNAAQLANLQARTGLTSETMQLLPQRVAAEVTRANAAMTSADATSERVGMEADSFKKLGFTPAAMGQYSHIASNFTTAANQQRIAADAAANALKAFVAANPGANIPPDQGVKPSDAQVTYGKMTDEVQKRTDAYQKYVSDHKQFMDGYDKFAKEVQQQAGGKASWTPPKPTGGTWKFVPTATLHNKAIGLNKDGTGYVYADGTPAK